MKKKQEEKNEAFEEKTKKPFDKMKFAQKIIATLVIIFMVFSVCGTLIYYLLNK